METIGNTSIVNFILACIFCFCSQANCNEREDNLLIVGGYKENHRNQASKAPLVEMIRMQHSSWTCDVINLKIPISEHSSVATSIGVIHCGGLRDGEVTSKCVLQSKNGQIRYFPSMVRPRRNFGLTSVHGILIAVGGEGGYQNTMEVHYGGSWTEFRLPFSVQNNCLVSTGNKVVSIGGCPGPCPFTHRNFLDSTWILNTMTNEWTKGPSLNGERADHSCFYDRKSNSVYVAGGRKMKEYPFEKLLNTAEKWKLDSNAWKKIGSLPTFRGTGIFLAAAVPSNSKKFIGFFAGGYTGYGLRNKVYGLRRKDEKWIDMPKRLLYGGRASHSMVNLAADEKPFTSYCAFPSWE